MAQNGGARPGAGRKRKTDKYGTAIQKAEKKIVDRLPQLLDNLIALADGVLVEEISPTGKPVVYQRPPDFKANEYLINRVMGKPTERQELSGPDGGPIDLKGYSTKDASPDAWDEPTTEA